MKKCPKCSRSYDDSQSFCLMDGTPLINETEEETLVRQQAPPPKKRGILLWIGLALLVFLGVSVVAAGFLIYKFSGGSGNVAVKRQSNSKVSPTPLPSATAKTEPTPAAATSETPADESSPKTEESKETSDDTDSDEITPIGWDTTASGFKGGDGQTYKFQCPPDGTEHIVWGSDIYTLDSSICTAAVHAGLFTLESGGTVTIEYRPGRKIYGSTVRNGITSKTYGEYPSSFIVR